MTPHPRDPVPVARLSSFYLFYYAALGAFTPYWSLFLTARGMSVTAISVMMGIWYATRIVAPTTWTSIAAASPRPIRWLRIGCVLTLLTFCVFLLPLPQPWMYPAMVVFCFFYNAVMPGRYRPLVGTLRSPGQRPGATPTLAMTAIAMG